MAEERRGLGRIRGRRGLASSIVAATRSCFGTAGSDADGFDLFLFSLLKRQKGYGSLEIRGRLRARILWPVSGYLRCRCLLG